MDNQYKLPDKQRTILLEATRDIYALFRKIGDQTFLLYGPTETSHMMLCVLTSAIKTIAMNCFPNKVVDEKGNVIDIFKYINDALHDMSIAEKVIVNDDERSKRH